MKRRPDSPVMTGRNRLIGLATIFLTGGAIAVLAVSLLADESKQVATLPGSRIPLSIGDRIKYVQGLSDVQKQELAEKKKKFDSLSPTQKKRLRELAKQLREHRDSAQLSSTLTMYHDFLISLDESEMIRLRTAADDPDKKIEVIRSIEQARTEWMKHFPRPADAAAIYQWTLELALKHRDRLVTQWSEALAEPPKGQPRSEGPPQGPGHFEQMLVKAVRSDNPERAELATVMVYRHAMWLARNRREECKRLDATDEEIDQLLSRLSPVLSGFYRNHDKEKRAELLRGWQQFATFTMGRGLPSDNEVYAEIPKLSEADQKQISQLPLDRKRWWLVKRAFEERMDFKPPPNQNSPPPGAQRPGGGWNNGFGGPRFEYWGQPKKREEGRQPGGKAPPTRDGEKRDDGKTRDGKPREGRPRDGKNHDGGPNNPPPKEGCPTRPESEESPREQPEPERSAESAEPESTQPKSTPPESTGPESTQPESTQPEPTQPKSEGPKSDKDEASEPDKAVRQFARQFRGEQAN